MPCSVICWFVRSYTKPVTLKQRRPRTEYACSTGSWVCVSQYILYGWPNQCGDERSMWTYGGDRKCIKVFDWETWRKQIAWNTCVDENIILKWILKDQVGRMWTGFIRLRIRTSNGLYSPKIQGMSWLTENQLTSEGVNYSWWSLFSWQSSNRFIPTGAPSRIGLPKLQEHQTASNHPVTLSL